KGLEVTLSIQPGIPEMVTGDMSKWLQVIRHLLNNAINFTEEGQIYLELGAKEVEEGSVQLVVEVIDTGIGIKPALQSQIFQPFFQADPSSQREVEGAGLGLSISRKMAALLQGEVLLVSSSEAGSHFRFSSRFSIPTMTFSDSLSILVVEDNPVNQMVVKKILAKLGHQPTTANHGQLALEKLNDTLFDLILMDIQMPVMDGIETAKRIREGFIPQQQHIPIIALTANATQENQKNCFEVGMNAFLTKPISKDILTATIQQVIVEKTWLECHVAAAPE
ncbi:MAG: response regulator, partial [Bacteroidota bacterium]